MQSPEIERIIENDRKAREAVAAAEKHRKDTAEMVAQKKSEMESGMRDELKNAAAAAVETSEEKNSRLTEEYRKNAGMICSAMEELYREKKSAWVDTYVERITKG